MSSHFIPNQALDSIVIPMPKEYSEMASKPSTNTYGTPCLIYEKEFDNLPGGKAFFSAIASGSVLSRDRGFAVEMMIVFCKEHDRPEMLPWHNLHYDLSSWYKIGRHPRFSIVGALLEAKQRYSEIERLAWGSFPPHLFETLRKSNTQKEFLELMDPYLMDDIHCRGHKFRVDRAFKRRFKGKSFTVDDFFSQRSQELRRVILRSVPIEEVLKRLKLVSQDAEGTLYDDIPNPDGWRFRRYLHVKCPSTGQDYLLEVPNDVATPQEARKWTFRLGADAEFVKEA